MEIQYGFISMFITMLLLWLIIIILEKVLNIKRDVYSVSFIESNVKNQNENGENAKDNLDVVLFRRLSRSIDSDGKYRMKTRASLQFATSIAFFALILCHHWSKY